jgi:hypothetical protein
MRSDNAIAECYRGALIEQRGSRSWTDVAILAKIVAMSCGPGVAKALAHGARTVLGLSPPQDTGFHKPVMGCELLSQPGALQSPGCLAGGGWVATECSSAAHCM